MRDALTEKLAGRDHSCPLDRAALEIARIEYPELDAGHYLELLDSFAGQLQRRLPPAAGGPEFLESARRYLFDELGFQGNQDDYYNPRNSFLNDVIDTRLGIPITLSVVFMEVARRLGRRVVGVGLPGHFVTRFDEGAYTALVDVFHGGQSISTEECAELARQTAGFDLEEDLSVMQPVDDRYILLRMLANLRGIYLSRRAWRKAIQVLDLIIAAHPDAADEYRLRAGLHVEEQNFAAARADLEAFLARAPASPDREEVEQQLGQLRHWSVRLN